MSGNAFTGVKRMKKIEEALSDAEEHNVKVECERRLRSLILTARWETRLSRHHAYALASADLFFTAGIAQNTVFFADVVGLSGPPPDLELGTLTLVNGYSARLVNRTN
jgi:hypothetical protein